MEKYQLDGLEIIANQVEESKFPPLLLLHGAFVGAWCWEYSYIPWFTAQNISCYAFSLRGHGASKGQENLDHLSINDYVNDLSAVIKHITKKCGQAPILLGHSMGGYVVYQYLQQNRDALIPAQIYLCAVPPQGLLAAQLQMVLQKPLAIFDFTQFMHSGKVNRQSLQDLLFYHPVSEKVMREVLANGQAESYRALWDMSANLPTTMSFWPFAPFVSASAKVNSAPCLVIGTENDAMIPASQADILAKNFAVKAKIFPAMGHLVTHEQGWEKITKFILDFLQNNL